MNIIWERSPEDVLNWQELEESNPYRPILQEMQTLVVQLQDDTVEYPYKVLGSFAHTHLLLRHIAGGPYVQVTSYPDRFIVRYLMKPENAPWEDAMVEGIPINIGNALDMILIALEQIRQ